tara:strand:- start:6863 stop:9481 length:2619 start_codon:yes stop_codon:yes gene_type:complete
MKKKEILFFIQAIILLFISTKSHANNYINEKSKHYSILVKENFNKQTKLKVLNQGKPYTDGKKIASLLKNESIQRFPHEAINDTKRFDLKTLPITSKMKLVAHTSTYNDQKENSKKEFTHISTINSPPFRFILKSISFGILLFCAAFYFILFISKNEKISLYCSAFSVFSIIWSFIELDMMWYFLKSSNTLSLILNKLDFGSLIGLHVANLYFIKELFNESKFLEKNSKFILSFSIAISIIYFLIPHSLFPKNLPIIFHQIHFFLIYSLILIGIISFYKKDAFAKFFTIFFTIVFFTAFISLVYIDYFLNMSSNYKYSFIFLLVAVQTLILILRNINKEILYLNQINQLKSLLPSIKDTLETEMNDLNSIFNEINEVILSLNFDGIVKKETNKELSKQIFGESQINKSIFNNFFSNLHNQNEFSNTFKNKLLSVEDLDLKEWIELKKDFPEKVFFSINKKEKALSIKYGELIDGKTQKIKEVLLIVQDVTDLEKMIENELRVNRRNIIISELVPEKGRNLEKHKVNLSNFFRESRTLISDSSKLASSKNMDSIDEWDEQFIWKNVNTVKNNSKFFGLNGLSSKLDEEEQKYLKLRPKKGKISDDLILEICSSLLAIIEAISDYEITAEEIFGLSANMKKAKKTSYIEVDKLDVMDKKIKLLSAKVELQEMDDVLKEWSHLFKSSLLDLLRGFESLVDLTSKEVGKNVSYRVGGDDIYLKESVLSKISDSVIHLLKNSIDHAIESPIERKSLGKDKKGNIEIKCLMLDSSFQLSVKDDGTGIDNDKIGEKAIANNIVTKEGFEKMLESEKVELIFKEGFSSKEEASKISGRGLGMDIIKKNIESLGGQIKINTKKGQGTEFILGFPFNLDESQ